VIGDCLPDVNQSAPGWTELECRRPAEPP
jgi:hypothetical protein